MYLSIRNKNWTEGQREQIRDAAEAERRQKIQQERDETRKLEELIYIYGFNENAYLYDRWMDAGPNTRTAYLQYCRDEWALIVSEIVFAHRLAGLEFIVQQNSEIV